MLNDAEEESSSQIDQQDHRDDTIALDLTDDSTAKSSHKEAGLVLDDQEQQEMMTVDGKMDETVPVMAEESQHAEKEEDPSDNIVHDEVSEMDKMFANQPLDFYWPFMFCFYLEGSEQYCVERRGRRTFTSS